MSRKLNSGGPELQERDITGRVASGEVRTVVVQRDRERAGWLAKLITHAGDEVYLETKRGREVRLFKTSDAVLRWCGRIGFREVTVYL